MSEQTKMNIEEARDLMRDEIGELVAAEQRALAENERLRSALRGMIKQRLGNEGYADGLWNEWAARYHNDPRVDRPLLNAVISLASKTSDPTAAEMEAAYQEQDKEWRENR